MPAVSFSFVLYSDLLSIRPCEILNSFTNAPPLVTEIIALGDHPECKPVASNPFVAVNTNTGKHHIPESTFNYQKALKNIYAW